MANLGDGMTMAVVAAAIFGAYHWWSGLPNIISATVIGFVLVLFYRRAGALWPVVVAHYLIDVIAFGLG